MNGGFSGGENSLVLIVVFCLARSRAHSLVRLWSGGGLSSGDELRRGDGLGLSGGGGGCVDR